MLAAAFLLAGSVAVPISAEPCRVLVKAKLAGDPVFAEDATAVPCPARWPQTLLRYDARRQIVVARVDLAPGSPLGITYLPPRPAVAVGETVQITAMVRHVVVSRTAVALQSARAGQRFFVRAEDGAIFAAPSVTGAALEERIGQ